MQTDVDHDAHGAEDAPRQHAQLVVGIVEVAELTHQPLGVQRPTLSVAADESDRALVAAEVLFQAGHEADLEMVAGNALVVRGRDLIPEREHGAATGRIPVSYTHLR